jgi:hypothetical protein
LCRGEDLGERVAEARLVLSQSHGVRKLVAKCIPEESAPVAAVKDHVLRECHDESSELVVEVRFRESAIRVEPALLGCVAVFDESVVEGSRFGVVEPSSEPGSEGRARPPIMPRKLALDSSIVNQAARSRKKAANGRPEQQRRDSRPRRIEIGGTFEPHGPHDGPYRAAGEKIVREDRKISVEEVISSVAAEENFDAALSRHG